MLDIIETANRLIKLHGEHAIDVAGEQAEARHEAGDELSYQRWKEVVIETKVLLARDYAE
jgi:hypothetical protein